MAKQFAKSFYNSIEWQRARQFVLGRSGGLCERCYNKGVVRTADVVHHIIWLTPANIHDPNITLNPKNLTALCQDCHAEVHAKREPRRYKVDADGAVTVTS